MHKLKQEAFDCLTAPAPPYFRLFLGARVMHEWGHLAHAAKFLRVADENKAAYKEARAELGDCFVQAIAAMPEKVRATDAETAGLVATLERASGSPRAQDTGARRRLSVQPDVLETATGRGDADVCPHQCAPSSRRKAGAGQRTRALRVRGALPGTGGPATVVLLQHVSLRRLLYR